MKNIFSGLLIVAGAYFVSAQETRNVGDFTSLKVYDRIPVELVKSNKQKVEVSSSNDTDVEVINKNGELKVRMTPIKKLQGQDSKVIVYYENLNDIQASQGAVITSDDEVDSRMLKLVSNEGSKITLKVDTNKLDVKGNSGGELNISGKAKSQDIIISSGAKFNGETIKSDNATVSTNAGGEVKVNASDSVRATTRAGGNITIYGDRKSVV